VEKKSLDLVTESLLADLDRMSIGGGGGGGNGGNAQQDSPSVFACQLRIFDGWFKQWSEEDKNAFAEMITEKDPERGMRLQQSSNPEECVSQTTL
jgi:hypothetical protein